MAFLDLVKARQSVRAYLDKPVEREKIDLCLDAARLAPSACNGQPWRFLVVDEPALKTAVAKMTFGKVVAFNHFTLSAPVLIAVVAQRPGIAATVVSSVKKKALDLVDIGMAVEHFCLQAAELGLGTCILGWLNEPGAARLLGLASGKRIVLALALGYPADTSVRPKKRRALDDVRWYNHYGGKGQSSFS